MRRVKFIKCRRCKKQCKRNSSQQLFCCGCAKARYPERTQAWRKKHVERTSVYSHWNYIFNPKANGYKTYKGMPFFNGWNPKKGGSFNAGEEWIVKHIGKRPPKSSLHIVKPEKGFVPGNLAWATRQTQNQEQLGKIIANLRHRIKFLEGSRCKFCRRIA